MKALVLLCLLCATALAQPTPPGGLSRVAHGASLTGDGKTLTPLDVRTATGGGLQGGGAVSLGLLTTCSTNQVLKWSGSAWACSAMSGGITNSAGANVVMKSDGTNAVASSMSDDATQVTTTEPISMGNVTGPTLINGPMRQIFTITDPAYAYGEVNRYEIGGIVPVFPKDLFVQVIRATVTADTTTGTARAGGIATEVDATKTAGGNTLNAIAFECSAVHGDVNNCIEALAGDVVVDAGNVLVNGTSNYIFQLGASGFIAAVGPIFAESNGTFGLEVSGAPTDSIRITSTAGVIDEYNASNSTLTMTNSGGGAFGLIVGGSITNTATKWTTGTGVPAISCAIGDLFTRTNGSSGTTLYSCTAVNTWTAVGSGGAGGITNGAGNNVVMKSDGTNAIASLWTDDGTTTKYNTTKFTLASSSGNATFAGTLDVTGAATADSGARIITAAGSGLTKTTNSLAIATQAGVVAASYTNSNITVDARGIITAISNGSGGSGITNSAGNNVMMKSDGTNAIASALTDNGTTLNYGSGGMTATTSGGVGAASYFSAPTIYGGTGSGKVLLHGGSTSLDFDAATNATATGFIDATGYAEGITQFRDLEIDDGKGTGTSHRIAYFAASGHLLTVGAGTDAATTTGTNLYATNAGTTSIVARDSTNHVEAFIGASSAGVFVGAGTGHSLTLETNSGTQAVIIDTSQRTKFLKHIGFAGSAPSLSSCGVGSAIDSDSNDTVGDITVGSSTSSCVVTFAGAYTNKGICTATPNAVAVTNVAVTAQSASSFTIAGQGSFGGGSAHIYYHCSGMNGF